VTLLKNAAAGIGLKVFPFGGQTATSGLRPGLGTLPLVGGVSQSYEQMYRGQLWLNVVINKLARGIGRLPLKTYALGADGERLRQRDGWLADSLARPMPGKPPFAWKQAIVGNICVYGNAVVVKVRPGPGKPPTELWTSSFRFWEVVPGKTAPVEAYVFHNAAGRRLTFAPEDVLHFKWWGTGNDLVAFSPMEPLRRTLMIEDAAQRLTAASYDNGARPSGVLVTDQQLKPDTAKRLQEQTASLHGGVDNAFKLAVLEGGLDWKPMSHSLVDAQVVETRRLTREECAAAYDVPPPVVGILDRATFSNITEQHIMLYQDTFGPWLTMIEETLQTQLIDPEPLLAGQYVEFDLNEVLKGNPKERFEALKAADFLTPNEKRALENRDRVDDPRADMLWMPLNMMPIGEGAVAMEERLARLQPAKATEEAR